jgi:H+/Cl- antiporter ClcA
VLYHYFGKKIESGNSLIINTINEPKETIPWYLAVFIFLGTIVTHLFGGSAGREGTALQMAGAIADQFYKPFKLNAEQRKILIIMAVSAGFGAVFGTPMAGAFFGLEFYAPRKLYFKAIIPAVMSSFLADKIARLCLVEHAQYIIKIIPEIDIKNIFYTCCAAVVFGIIALVFIKTMNIVKQITNKLIKFPPLRPFVGGLFFVFTILAIDDSKYMGLGISTIQQSFHEPLPFFIFLLKMVSTVITISFDFKGGEVTPLFFIGATLGNALSSILPLPIGLLAGMGLVAVFTGATNTPIACIILGIELFGFDCGIYLAIACLVAYFVSGKSRLHIQKE